MKSWLRRALTPPKWVRDATGMGTSDIHDVLSPSGSLGNLYDGLNPSRPPAKNVVLNAQEQQLIYFGLIAGGLYLLLK